MQGTICFGLALALLVAGCSSGGGSFALRKPFEARPNGFWYRHDCPDRWCAPSQEAEAERLRQLDERVRRAGLCPHGYVIEHRSMHGITYTSAPDIVVYEGRCKEQ